MADENGTKEITATVIHFRASSGGVAIFFQLGVLSMSKEVVSGLSNTTARVTASIFRN